MRNQTQASRLYLSVLQILFPCPTQDAVQFLTSSNTVAGALTVFLALFVLTALGRVSTV
jgi:hypothetical protein